MIRHIGPTHLAVAAALALSASTAWGARELVDRVVAVVEDDAIFASDVEQALKQLLFQRGITAVESSQRATLEKQVLDELINNKLIIAKAGRLGVEVPFSDVEKRVEKAIEERMRTLGGEAAFRRQLEAEGLTMTSLKQLYREQIRNRMLADRVLAADLDRGSLSVTDADLRAAFEARRDDLPKRPQVVHLRTIYIALKSSERAKEEARARIEELHRRVEAGEDFAALAAEYSDDPSAKNGGRLGSVKLADLSDRTFAEAAARLGVGEVSDPVFSSYGYHLIKVTGADSTKQEVELSHILVRVNPGERDVQEVFRRANEVHARLLAGAPFDSTAMRYSDDPATASAGGDLGWLRLNDLPEFFRDVLRGMTPGDISPVLREPTGFRIVQLLEREDERPYRYEEVREELRKIVEQEKLAAAYESYFQALRSEFYVDVRGE